MTWKSRKIKCNGYDEALIFILNEDQMFPIILDGYQYLFKNNLTFIDLIEINFGGIDQLKISLDLDESFDTLDKLIVWLEKKERYEECQEILNFKGTRSELY